MSTRRESTSSTWGLVPAATSVTSKESSSEESHPGSGCCASTWFATTIPKSQTEERSFMLGSASPSNSLIEKSTSSSRRSLKWMLFCLFWSMVWILATATKDQLKGSNWIWWEKRSWPWKERWISKIKVKEYKKRKLTLKMTKINLIKRKKPFSARKNKFRFTMPLFSSTNCFDSDQKFHFQPFREDKLY